MFFGNNGELAHINLLLGLIQLPAQREFLFLHSYSKLPIKMMPELRMILEFVMPTVLFIGLTCKKPWAILSEYERYTVHFKYLLKASSMSFSVSAADCRHLCSVKWTLPCVVDLLLDQIPSRIPNSAAVRSNSIRCLTDVKIQQVN